MITCHNTAVISNNQLQLWEKGLKEEHPVTSPHSAEVIGHFTVPNEQQIKEIIQQADQASKAWARFTMKERAAILFKARHILLERFDEIASLKSSECGKTLGEAKAGLAKGIEVLEFATSLQNSDLGGKMEVSKGVSCEFLREPLGVVLSITPFNFPAMVPMWTIPIALACGNAIIWKPSEKTPLTAKLIAEAFADAGLPHGLLSVVHGGASTVETLIKSPTIKAVSFVGSTAIARKVYQMASHEGKRVLALGGAKNHIILLPDCQNEVASKGIFDSFTGCAGQRCMAASVLLAVGSSQNVIDQIVSSASNIVLGENMGAIIDEEQLHFLHQSIAQAEKEGAKILVDGRKIKKEKGFWIGPTILDDVSPDSEAARRELFGPILSIIRCKTLDDALVIENTNPYGNACSVFTQSGGAAQKVTAQARAGMIGINVGVPVPREPFSFGGIGDSKFGHGEITGPQSVNFWTNLKKVTTKWQQQEQSNWMS